MITLANTTIQENRESVLFQPVLKAYPTHHSWIITGHVLLGNLGKAMENVHMADGQNT